MASTPALIGRRVTTRNILNRPAQSKDDQTSNPKLSESRHASGGAFLSSNERVVHRTQSAIKKSPQGALLMADRVGFEPTEPLQARRISSAVPSTTRPPVHR